MLRRAAGRKAEPSAVIHDSRTLRATPESGERAGDDGAKRKQSSKLHMAVDRLGHFLALHVTPANANDRAQVEHLARAVQAATDDSVEIAFVDQGHAGQKPATAARMEGESIPEIFPSTAARRGLEAPARYDQAGFATRRVQSRDSRSRPSRPLCRLSAGPRLAQGPARSLRFPHGSGTTGTSP